MISGERGFEIALAGLQSGRENHFLGSTPSNAQVQQLGDAVPPKRWKRTTPFSKQCNFIIDLGTGELEQCDAFAEVGIYYGDDHMVKMTSLCLYHAIYQESLWIGGME
jgi:hypothetical protein